MNQMIDQNSSADFDDEVRMQYMTTIAAFAKECGIYEIVDARPNEYSFSAYQKFAIVVKDEVARIRLRNRTINRSTSVLLQETTKAKIKHYLSRLEVTIQSSELPSERRVALQKKLEEFRSELSQPRLGFAKSFGVLAFILAGLGSATTIAAEGPAAVAHIMQLIGRDRETEEAAAQRLSPPPKVLAPPEKPRSEARSKSAGVWLPATDDLDDDIPF